MNVIFRGEIYTSCEKSVEIWKVFSAQRKNFDKSIDIQDHQIIAINLEDMDNEELLDYKKLYNYVKERLCKDQITYIFIDEVQNCINFEKAVDSLFIKEDTDVYIAGSNAYMLSGDRYDIKGRQFLKTLGKYYLVDMGIRNLLISGYSTDLDM